MARRKRLGEILVDQGLISEKELVQALASAKQDGLKIGEYLSRKAIVSETDILNAVADQLNLKKYAPGDYAVIDKLADVIDVETAAKLSAIPVKKEDNILTIAMLDPLDIMAVDYVEVMSGLEVEPIICSEQNFYYLMSTLYGIHAEKDGLLKQVRDITEQQTIEVDDPGDMPIDIHTGSLEEMAEQAPVIRLVNSILSQAVREQATDIHISPEKDHIEIRFRVDGKLNTIPAPPKSMFLPIISRIKILANLDISVSRIPQDGRMSIVYNDREINIRISTMPTVYGENMVLRLLDTSSGIHGLKKLGFADPDIITIRKMIRKPYGMILCTGPTGSGKNTSLFSMLQEINSPDINIITLEDPVEYRMEHVRQAQVNHKAGMTFASGLRAILRQDPDIVMVGEIRDAETASVAVQAALTGHLVFSTVHTNDAVGAVARFVDMGIDPFMVASVMLITIAQRLVRRVCPHCCKSYVPGPDLMQYWQLESDTYTFKRAKGCHQCLDTGYRGRIGLYETLHIDEEIRRMIIENCSATQIKQNALRSGRLRSLKQDALQKVIQGITTSEEAMSAILE